MKWNDLTMEERSDLMSLFLKSGVGSLSDMRHIYDGESDTGYNGGTLKESKVSDKLSRNQWNDLYRKGKVSISEVPREYQSWIEGENSEFKKGITKAISDFGENYVAPAMMAALSLNPVLGASQDIAEIAFNLGTGNLAGAGIAAATAFLPEAIGETAKTAIKSRKVARMLSRAELDKRLLDASKSTQLYSKESQKVKGEIKQGVKTLGVHRRYGTGRITGSQDITDPSNKGPINYGPSRFNESVEEVPQKTLHVKNAKEYFEYPRGEYAENGLSFDDGIEMSMGMRPQPMKRFKDERGITVIPYVKQQWPINNANGQWLPNKDINYLWTDMEDLPIELYHKNGGYLTFY